MGMYEYYPNEESFDFDDDRSDKASGNCPGCDKQSLRIGSCGQMDSGALIKCGQCGWNCDYSFWCETEMHRLRAENEHMQQNIALAILSSSHDNTMEFLRQTLGHPKTSELWAMAQRNIG